MVQVIKKKIELSVDMMPIKLLKKQWPAAEGLLVPHHNAPWVMGRLLDEFGL